jgi:hypothetical protein
MFDTNHVTKHITKHIMNHIMNLVMNHAISHSQFIFIYGAKHLIHARTHTM